MQYSMRHLYQYYIILIYLSLFLLNMPHCTLSILDLRAGKAKNRPARHKRVRQQDPHSCTIGLRLQHYYM
jgi:hypothetical protein